MENEAEEKFQHFIAIKTMLENFQSMLDKQQEFMAAYDSNNVATRSFIRRRDTIIPLVAQYTDNFNQACFLTDNQGKEDLITANQKFQDNYSDVINWFEHEIALRNKSSPSSSEHPNPRLQLPSFDLPKFDGATELSMNFRDTFKSLIHDNNQLSSSTKFRYLKMSITDKFSPVSHLSETDDGYDDAWKIVLGKYDDKRKMMERHFQALISAKKMQSEDAALDRLLPPEELLKAFVAHLLLRRLEQQTRNVIETESQLEILQWNDLSKRLEKRIKVLNLMPKFRTSTVKPALTLDHNLEQAVQ